MDQTVDGLSVYMSDEVTSAKTSFLGGTPILHMLWLEQKKAFTQESYLNAKAKPSVTLH